jgi:hypothetical protein
MFPSGRADQPAAAGARGALSAAQQEVHRRLEGVHGPPGVLPVGRHVLARTVADVDDGVPRRATGDQRAEDGQCPLGGRRVRTTLGSGLSMSVRHGEIRAERPGWRALAAHED